MISATSAFNTANAALNKQPLLVVLLRNCPYAFSTAAIAGATKAFPDIKNGALVGAFTDSGGNVVQPVAIGTAPTTLIVPAGATQLQLGINQQNYNDSSGSFTVKVTVNAVTTTVTVTSGNGPWLFTGGINSAFPYSELNNPPTTTCIAASGLTTGALVQVQYVSGTVQIASSIAACDADGTIDPAIPSGYGIGATLNYVQALNGHFASGYMGSTIQPWLVSVADHSITVNDLEGGTSLSDLTFNVQDYLQQITALFPNYIFEGQRITLLMGFVGMTIDQFVPMFTGVIDTVASANGNAEFQFTCPSANAAKLSGLIYTTGDDGFPVDSSHPRSINGHPIDILVSALQQAGVPIGSIDTAKLDYYRDTIYGGLSFVFSLTSAPTAKDFIQNELMKPLGAYLRENNLGTMTANFFYPALSGNGSYTPQAIPVVTEDQTKATEVPIAGEAALIDQVTFRFDDDGTGNGKFLAESIQNFQPSLTRYGLVGAQIIESKGMRSAFQGFFWSQAIARVIFMRYGSKNLVLSAVPFFWSECLLEEGDILALTLPQVPNRAGGTFGIASVDFEVLDVNRRFSSGLIEVTLLAISFTSGIIGGGGGTGGGPLKQFLITPNGEPSFASDTPTNQAKYMYLSDSSGKYSTGVVANTLS